MNEIIAFIAVVCGALLILNISNLLNNRMEDGE